MNKEELKFKLDGENYSCVSDVELIYTVVGSIEAAEDLYRLSGENLNTLSKMSVNDLSRAKGMTKRKAQLLTATMEISRRRIGAGMSNCEKITCSKDAYSLLFPFMADLRHEEIWVILLNSGAKVIKKEQLFKGGTAECSFDIKIILKKAIENMASGIIISHNHPSGNSKPSASDDKMTNALSEACKLINIKLLDHIIVADGGYHSYTDNGALHC